MITPMLTNEQVDAIIVEAARAEDCLPETCHYVDYEVDIGRVPEYWRPRHGSRVVAQAVLAAVQEANAELAAERDALKDEVRDLDVELARARAERDALLEALRQISQQCEGNNWSGGDNVYLSRKWIIKLCSAAIDEVREP